jgi:CheY-like chemotaxis protein
VANGSEGGRLFTLPAQGPYREPRKGLKARIRKSRAPPKDNNSQRQHFDKAGTAGSGDRPGCLTAAPGQDGNQPVTHANGNALNGLRILIVEDEAAISLLLEDMLLDFGCEVVGPAGRLAAALDLAASETFDLAILDVNVAGESIYPVAEALEQRKVPFVFSTGYGSAGIKDVYRDRPVVQKPFAQSDLRQRLLSALESDRSV